MSRRCDIGRYITGDIEHKFWFGVQSSGAADRFGRTGYEPNYIQYYFGKYDLPAVVTELSNIELAIGTENMKALDAFFASVDGYNDEILAEAGVLDIWNTHQSDYADYSLGLKIRDWLLDHDYCAFDAEL